MRKVKFASQNVAILTFPPPCQVHVRYSCRLMELTGIAEVRKAQERSQGTSHSQLASWQLMHPPGESVIKTDPKFAVCSLQKDFLKLVLMSHLATHSHTVFPQK